MLEKYKELIIQAQKEQKKLKQELELLTRKKNMTIIKLFHQTHEEIFEEIDCTLCANCCKELGPKVVTPDIQKLAKVFKMKPTAFTEKYLKEDKDRNKGFKDTPCPFIGKDNLCFVYDDRPRACRNYPHTQDRDIHKRLKRLALDATYCPGAFLIAKKVLKNQGISL